MSLKSSDILVIYLMQIYERGAPVLPPSVANPVLTSLSS